MSFESVWGFDPKKTMPAESHAHNEPETNESMYSADERRAARIPVDVDSQIYELRRMYRL